MKREKKVIPVKNYIYLFIIIIVTVLIVFYFYLWYLTYEESKLNNQIMDRYLQVINYNELSNYVDENNNAFIYVSVLEDKKIRDFELEFKKLIIDSSNLKKEILYNKNLINKVKQDYQKEEKNITNVPCILVFKNGVLSQIYDIKENNYDITKIKTFLEEEGIDLND